MTRTTSPFERTALLKNAIGDCVLTDKEDCFKASYDGMRLSFMPEAVVKVTEEWQVGETLTLANKFKIPVTVRGTGSTLTGSATPICGGWVIDLSNLTSIEIDPINSMAYVGAGAITGKIQAEAEKMGLFYPPDPASLKFCTIGGNIACNAGGLRCVKYGVTRDYIIALRGYLPTGEAVSWGRPLKKFAAGYNLRDLWIGSEGTLGVVTHAVLKLVKKPSSRWTCLAAFPNEEDALKAAEELLAMRVVPSALEFLDRLTVKGVEKETLEHMFDNLPGRSLLLIEVDGTSADVVDAEDRIMNWVRHRAEGYLFAKTDQEAERLWRIRRQCSKAMFQHGDTKLNEDVVVPITRMHELVHFIQNIAEETHLKIPTFGHAGDGNLHVNIMYHKDNEDEVKRAADTLDRLMEKVVELGGAITGEHGIGLAKSSYLHLQYNEVEINTMLKIKHALDPNGILNPQKIFNNFHPWEYNLIDVVLPWEKQEGKS